MNLQKFIEKILECTENHDGDDAFHEVQIFFEHQIQASAYDQELSASQLFSLIAHIYSAYRKLLN